jgi:hypothetical protein
MENLSLIAVTDDNYVFIPSKLLLLRFTNINKMRQALSKMQKLLNTKKYVVQNFVSRN